MIAKLQAKLQGANEGKWQLMLNHISLVRAVYLHFGLSDDQKISAGLNLLYEFSSNPKREPLFLNATAIFDEPRLQAKHSKASCSASCINVAALRARPRSFMRSSINQYDPFTCYANVSSRFYAHDPRLYGSKSKRRYAISTTFFSDSINSKVCWMAIMIKQN